MFLKFGEKIINTNNVTEVYEGSSENGNYTVTVYFSGDDTSSFHGDEAARAWAMFTKMAQFDAQNFLVMRV